MFRALSLLLILPLLLPLLILFGGCGPTNGIQVGNETRESIALQEGYYESEMPDDRQVPLVSIRVESGKTYVYSFLRLECGGRVFASFSETGIVFNDHAVRAPGPSVIMGGGACEVKSEITARSEDSVEVTVFLNGFRHNAYVLAKTDRFTFVSEFNRLASRCHDFSMSSHACLRSFGETCEDNRVGSR
ncbi:MAG: hypothetical protein HC902_02975 [Calothrix sp. SM1_5_4]|nr:hypothetical protein [Calothrix sp. SM1_5_4]